VSWLKGGRRRVDSLRVSSPRPREGSGRALRLLAPCAVAVATLLVGQVLPSSAAPPPRGETLAEARAAATALRAELNDLRARSAEAIHRLEEAEDTLEVAVSASLELQKQVAVARAEAAGTDDQLSRRVSALYRSGGTVGMWATLLNARDPQDLVARKRNVDKVVAADVHLRDSAQVSSGELQDLEARAHEHAATAIAAKAVEEHETAQLNALMAQQTEALARASARVHQIVEQERRAAAVEASRQLLLKQAEAVRLESERLRAEHAAAVQAALAAGQAPPPAPSYRGSSGVGPAAGAYVGPPGVCPVGTAHSFTDTWHAPRSGGRKHQGTDIFAPHGAPAYAVVDGVIDKVGNGGLGGITLWLRGANGDRYYYAHNAANLVRVGDRVKAGQAIAYVGKTGNAETTPPHIHFEAHPGGGAARNPAPWLAALCAG
jgi:murein DD-endopeptidase MepM/ murein hydrolase activator NlpD